MTSLSVDSADRISISLSNKNPQAMAASAYSPSGVMSGLPSNHLLKSYTSMTSLITAARVVLGNLNQHNDAGNQYIVVLGLPKSIRTHLNEGKNALDGTLSASCSCLKMPLD
jgi:hypothetical protein